MKKLIYSALIGSLAFALSAQAADEKHPQNKGRKGHSTVNVQKASGRTGGSTQARMYHNSNAVHLQRNNTAMVKQNKMQNHNRTTLHHNNVNNAVVQQNTAIKQSKNTNFARTKTAVGSQQNLTANRQVNINRHRNVTVTNNWRSSHFSAPQYSAFRNYHRQWHDRNWYSSRYNRIVLFGGGNYYWDNGYWYPAWGYNSGYRYGYDGPIYGYNDLAPGDVVTNVQVQLQQAGYYDGAIDGSLGPMTRRAIAAFQADRGLAITSAIDQPTLATLGLV